MYGLFAKTLATMKFNKVILIFILLIADLLLVNAQYNIRLNNIWDNSYYINPAAVNDEYSAIFSIAARKQWIGFPGAPSTYYVSGTTFLPKSNTQFGLKIYADNVGYNTITNVSFSYAYNLNLNKEWQLDLGLAASYQCLSYDRSQISTMTVDDPALYENLLQQNNYNSDVGFELKNKSWRIGASAQNLLSAFFTENKILTNANYAYVVYRKKEDQVINLQYAIDAIQFGNIFQMEFSLTSFFKFYDRPDLFHLGLFYRTRTEMGVVLGYNISESFNLAYSYDFNVSGISQNTVGSHELVVTYKLDKINFKPYRY